MEARCIHCKDQFRDHLGYESRCDDESGNVFSPQQFTVGALCIECRKPFEHHGAQAPHRCPGTSSGGFNFKFLRHLNRNQKCVVPGCIKRYGGHANEPHHFQSAEREETDLVPWLTEARVGDRVTFYADDDLYLYRYCPRPSHEPKFIQATVIARSKPGARGRKIIVGWKDNESSLSDSECGVNYDLKEADTITDFKAYHSTYAFAQGFNCEVKEIAGRGSSSGGIVHDISNWRAWAHNMPGECACGIVRSLCIYHR